MARRLWIYTSRSEDRAIARIAEQAVARAQADGNMGIANWLEYDGTADVLSVLGELVNAARERVTSADGSGRWRWRTISDTLKAWLGEPPTHVCPTCDQQTTVDVTRSIDDLKRQLRDQQETIARLEEELRQAVAAASDV